MKWRDEKKNEKKTKAMRFGDSSEVKSNQINS